MIQHFKKIESGSVKASVTDIVMEQKIELELLFRLLTKEYEVKINQDMHDNGKDSVWVVDLYHYETDNDDTSYRGTLNQSLFDLLMNICQELYGDFQ